jgi:hypothetical protein
LLVYDAKLNKNSKKKKEWGDFFHQTLGDFLTNFVDVYHSIDLASLPNYIGNTTFPLTIVQQLVGQLCHVFSSTPIRVIKKETNKTALNRWIYFILVTK